MPQDFRDLSSFSYVITVDGAPTEEYTEASEAVQYAGIRKSHQHASTVAIVLGLHIRPEQLPREAQLIKVAYSEVANHMKVGGNIMWAGPVNERESMVQLYNDKGLPFSAPITAGEAGWR